MRGFPWRPLLTRSHSSALAPNRQAYLRPAASGAEPTLERVATWKIARQVGGQCGQGPRAFCDGLRWAGLEHTLALGSDVHGGSEEQQSHRAPLPPLPSR